MPSLVPRLHLTRRRVTCAAYARTSKAAAATQMTAVHVALVPACGVVVLASEGALDRRRAHSPTQDVVLYLRRQ